VDYDANMVSYAVDRLSNFFHHEEKRCSALKKGPASTEYLIEFANTLRQHQEQERSVFVANLKTLFVHTKRWVMRLGTDVEKLSWRWYMLYHR
jgi:hypothetical protein